MSLKKFRQIINVPTLVQHQLLLFLKCILNEFNIDYFYNLDWIGNKKIELAVEGNGVGLPEDFDIEKSHSLGLQLVTMLAEGQLGGKLKVNGKCEAKFQIQFALQELVE